MVVLGYVTLKVQKNIIYYADWTNTRRKYRLNSITFNNVKDLKRVFNGKTIVLIVNIERTLAILKRILGPINTTKCIEVEDIGPVSQILNHYLDINQKKKSYYNYQREHWLSLISVINIHLLLNGGKLPKEKILKIVKRELIKYKRNISCNVLVDKFISMGLYMYHKNDTGEEIRFKVHLKENYKDSMTCLADKSMD